MIIRDAIVTEEVRSLAPPRADRSLASTIALAARESERAEEAARDVPQPTPLAVASAPAEPELTFEKVAAWLAVQDGETRTACASLLAQELTLVYENAKTEGHRAGEAVAQEKVQAATRASLQHMSAIAAAAETRFQDEVPVLMEACADIVTTAFTKLAGARLVTRDAAIGAVEQVLARVKEGRELTIRVNNADVAALNDVVDDLTEAFAGRKVQVVADARIELGGCIVESKHGALDGRFESQLRELFETLRAAKLATGDRQ